MSMNLFPEDPDTPASDKPGIELGIVLILRMCYTTCERLVSDVSESVFWHFPGLVNIFTRCKDLVPSACLTFRHFIDMVTRINFL